MLVVGEKINSIILSVRKIIEERDKRALQKLALEQIEQGARVLDVNADDVARGDPETSKENMRWAIKAIREATDIPLMIDSPEPEVLAAGLEVYDQSQGAPFLNSLNEKNKEEVVQLLLDLDYECNVVVMVDLNARKSVEEKLEMARELHNFLQEKGVSSEKIYIDPAVSPIGFNPQGALRVIEVVKRIKEELGLKTICAPSNVSYYGGPGRKLLNTVFIRMLKDAGVDAVIANPLDVFVDISQEEYEVARAALKGEDRRLRKYIEFILGHSRGGKR